SFRATLEEARAADLLLHVIDAGHAAWEEQVDVVESVLDEMGLYASGNGGRSPDRKRVVHVFNKADLVGDPDALLAQVRERFPHAVLTSAGAGVGRAPEVQALRSVLRTSAEALRPVARIRVPVGDGRLLAELHRESHVLNEVHVDGVVEVTARVEARMLGRLRREGVDVELGERGHP
ncbi:MAG TPA: GTPase HflX, partial [Gemmatimonadales bacterium]|nr:GTPase HflX [Gemmatimonadales bacterium]